jgi:hypothetical protein
MILEGMFLRHSLTYIESRRGGMLHLAASLSFHQLHSPLRLSAIGLSVVGVVR